MPRIYKPVGPASNKAEAGPTENKNTAPAQGAKTTEDGKKKGGSGDK